MRCVVRQLDVAGVHLRQRLARAAAAPVDHHGAHRPAAVARAGVTPARVRGVHGAARRRRPDPPSRPLRDAARPRRVALWRTEERDDAADGRLLIEEGHDFLLSIDGGDVYVLSKGGHLASAATLHAGDEVSVFGFADEIPDRWGLAPALHGRGGLLPAVRSGSELPLLLTQVRGESSSSARRGPSREGPGREG